MVSSIKVFYNANFYTSILCSIICLHIPAISVAIAKNHMACSSDILQSNMRTNHKGATELACCIPDTVSNEQDNGGEIDMHAFTMQRRTAKCACCSTAECEGCFSAAESGGRLT
jgi:hypothetical protein